ncbi:MAG: hypothetical protein ABF301_04260 [Sulfurovum sp.]|jgi:hypothetical protein
MKHTYKKPRKVIEEIEFNFFEFDENTFIIKPKSDYSKHLNEILKSNKRLTGEFTSICLTLTSNGIKYFVDKNATIHLEQFVLDLD